MRERERGKFWTGRSEETSATRGHLSNDLKSAREPCGYMRESGGKYLGHNKYKSRGRSMSGLLQERQRMGVAKSEKAEGRVGETGRR